MFSYLGNFRCGSMCLGMNRQQLTGNFQALHFVLRCLGGV